MTEVLIGTAVFVAVVLGLAMLVLLARRLLVPVQPVALVINGGRTVTSLTGRTLLDALNAARITIPSACGGKGTCGLCRVEIETGASPPLPIEMARLSRQELRAGTRLACQVRLRHDLALRIDPAYLDSRAWACPVLSSRSLTPTIKEIILEVPPDRDFRFRPGQWVQITVPPYRLDFRDIAMSPEHQDMWRASPMSRLSVHNDQPLQRGYSMANRPRDAGVIVLNVRLALPPPSEPDAPPGLGSSYLFGLKPGDTVQVAGPFGEFAARETDAEMVFVGGGVGMAPLRAIIHDQLEARRTARKISYWYGARTPADIFYADEFQQLASAHENFQMTVAISDARQADGRWPTGFVHEVLNDRFLSRHPAPESCEYYLCGPPLMIRAVRGVLDQAGVDDDVIFFDDFGG